MADLLQAEVGHPDELRAELRRLGKVIALRATCGKAEGLTLAKRHPRNLFSLAAARIAREVWDVWNDARKGGGPPDGICYGTLIVDRSGWEEGGRPITITEGTEEHVKLLIAQAPRA